MAHDYSRVHGPAAEGTNLDFLRTQTVQQQGEIARLNQEMAMRAIPTLANLTDALMFCANQARMGNGNALQQLKLFKNALDLTNEVIEAKAKIIVPH